MEICRISKLFNNIIAGIDLNNIFKEGHVYDVTEITGVIIIKDLGKNGLTKEHYGWEFSDIMKDGSHLLTKEEKEKTITNKTK